MRMQRHRHEGTGDNLAGGQEDVHLPVFGLIGDLVGQVDQLVSRLAHGRDDDDHGGALLLAGHDAEGHVLDPSASATELPPYFWTMIPMAFPYSVPTISMPLSLGV